MDIRLAMERTQALNLFWEREIDKFLKLKPATMINNEEIVGIQEQLSTARSGVSNFDMGELWKQWTEGYKELVKLATDTTRDNSRDEIIQIYGVTHPVQKKEKLAGEQ